MSDSNNEPDFDICFGYNGIEICRSDFGNSLTEYVAWRLGNIGNIHCRDKVAALVLLRYFAEQLIEKILTDSED